MEYKNRIKRQVRGGSRRHLTRTRKLEGSKSGQKRERRRYQVEEKL